MVGSIACTPIVKIVNETLACPYNLYHIAWRENINCALHTMPMSREEIENCIGEAFPDAVIDLVDLAGDNDHWSLTITSPAFTGKSRLEQHKMVYSALKGRMATTLHALQLKTQAPQ